MTDSRVIFIGGIFPVEQEKEILEKSKRRPQMAANNYQWCFINGLDSNLLHPVTIINRKYVGSYPKNYKEAFVKELKFSHTKGAKDVDLGFVNISVLRNIIPPYREKQYINQYLQAGSHNVFFFYSIGERNLRLANYIRKKNPNSIIVFYIPDLPQYVMLSIKQSIFVKMHRNILSRKVTKTIKLSDVNVLITKQQAEKLMISQDKCVVVEAIVQTDNKTFYPIEETNEFIIVYAGTLARQYDIMDLVDSFKMIDNQKAKLYICGDGDAVDDIRNAQQIDGRIKYLGVLNSDEVNKLYKRASLLINPRRNGKEYTKYSFPSKTIDYMLAGRPVLCQKLEGIPDEYDNYLLYYDMNDEFGLSSAIEKLMELSIEELNEIGKRNFEFAVNHKNSISQTKKIIDFIKIKNPGLEI